MLIRCSIVWLRSTSRVLNRRLRLVYVFRCQNRVNLEVKWLFVEIGMFDEFERFGTLA